MNRFRFALNLLALVVLILAANAAAQAQARSWVSGVGNDADPCSFTAPCKTYSGAYNKTSMNGEISVKDTGAYGTINIQKSITIDGHENFASTIASGTTGIIINITDPADTKKTVRLRNLNINGTGGVTAGPGVVGIRILAADKVYIEDCLIEGFDGAGAAPNGRGISDERTGSNKVLFVTNTTIRNNRVNGIAIAGGSTLTAVLDHVRVYGNGDSGILANSKVVIMDSNVAGNGNAGVHANTANADVSIERTVISGNTNHGVYSGPGAAATVRMSETMITRNGSGITFGGGTIHTFGNCRIAGNTMGNGPPTSDLGGQQ
ncbi:MAG TPA: right-handed parallel beta-helix repeat-containing protein [Pyrinomonadaceae bacterium]|nr:right-handed parallel beta-helix repeat-containing protein [Pyrinomonadaceae bacterium]